MFEKAVNDPTLWAEYDEWLDENVVLEVSEYSNDVSDDELDYLESLNDYNRMYEES